MSGNFKYDVFLSHSFEDTSTARMLADRLKADGLRVWFREWKFNQRNAEKVSSEQALNSSRALVLLVSAAALASEWIKLEHQTNVFRDPSDAQRRFIPVRLDDSELTGPLKQFACIDWQQRSEDEYKRLLIACVPPLVEVAHDSRLHETLSPIKILQGSPSVVWGLAVSQEGQWAVSGYLDRSICIWNLESGDCEAILKGHSSGVTTVALSSDGSRLVSGSRDGTVRLWDLRTRSCIATLADRYLLSNYRSTGTAGNAVLSVAMTVDGKRVIVGSDSHRIELWDVEGQKRISILSEHTSSVTGVALSYDGTRAISGSHDRTVRVWDLEENSCVAVLKGHTGPVIDVALTPDGKRAISGSDDMTVRVWDLENYQCIATLEGHTGGVRNVALSSDGRVASSSSRDNTVRVWNLVLGICLAVLKGHSGSVQALAMTPDGQRLISGADDFTVRVWTLPVFVEPSAQIRETTRYTNAKVLLVGDSGVGKSGLALRLTEDRFESTISTDAVWATQLRLPHEIGSEEIEREIWLWDFAGQADYRLIHQLYMDETSVAVLVFNPQSENPFEGLGQWERDLQRASRRAFKKILVAGRCDRGGLMVSRKSINSFCEERGFSDYLETSAYTGSGCAELRNAIIHNIPWDTLPWTASPRIFKLLKEEIIRLRDRGKVLLRMAELKQQLDMRELGETFTLEQLRTVVGLLAGPGIIWQLEFGDFVLLQPERINAYAAAVIRSIRAHTEEIGCIHEEDILAGKLVYEDVPRLAPDEEQIVLRAMHQTFVEHGLALREHTDIGTLLVFPSYFKRERPELETHPAAFITYRFVGAIDEIYSTLVVRLHYTPAFEKDRLWRFAADFKTHEGRRVGLKLVKKPEGAAEITVYFDPGIPDDTKVTFIRYIHDHLKAKDSNTIRIRHYVCPHDKCGEPVEGIRAIQIALQRGETDIPCQFCRKAIPLLDLIEEKFASDEFQQRVKQLEAQARINIDNESRELILIGHAFSVAGEAGQIFRPTPNSDWGVDGEIELKNDKGEASGKRVYLQLKSGNSYLRVRRSDGKEVFSIKNKRHVSYWQSHAYPVMLVIRSSNGQIRWMNVTDYLRRSGHKNRQIVFEGEPFTALSVVKLRNRILRESDR